MAKHKKKRISLTPEEKTYKALQALFILHARQLNMSNEEMRSILGIDQADVAATAMQINKALKRYGKNTQKRNP